MGYTTKDIAVITEPKKVSLAALPNFVQFASKPRIQVPYEAEITIHAIAYQWINGYYDNMGALISSNAPFALEPVDVSAYAGQAFTTDTISIPPAYCVVKNAAGAVVLVFTRGTGDPIYAGVFPADAKTLYMSRATGFGHDNPYLKDSTGTDILNKPWETLTVLRITEPNGTVHEFNGTEDLNGVSSTTYFISSDTSATAENLRQVLLLDPWVSTHFNLAVPFVWDGTSLHNGSVLAIKSSGFGAEYNIQLAAPNDISNTAYIVHEIQTISKNDDSISGEEVTAQIALDIYTGTPVFLGADDRPTSAASLGTYIITLNKTYSGVSLWFDVNGLFTQYARHNVPTDSAGWFDTGTLTPFRFVARMVGVNSYSFYQSNALYVLNGYDIASSTLDLTEYIYSIEKIKLLTNKPRTIYVKGQREYINFLYSDADRGVNIKPDWVLRIIYRAYSTTDEYLGEGFSDAINRTALNMVNTCPLRIDDVLTSFPNAGIIRVALARGNAIISNDLEYTIRPSALHQITQFTFLNKLGGWDTFNFDSAPSDAIKVTFDTYDKTITPGHKRGDGVETVYAAQLDDTKQIDGAPVTDEVADWLKELAASAVVLDASGYYLIKTEFTLNTSDTTTNMQVPTMKYRLSETYTNE